MIGIALALALILGTAFGYLALREVGFFRKPLPIRIERRCGERLVSGLPIEMWLIFANPAGGIFTLTVTIEYEIGKSMTEHIAIAPGEQALKIPEPNRVNVIVIHSPGYSDVLVRM
ncbi:MAG: hypothetical protein EXS16_11015 [Gemmataceae bacterium]|nr:hypothetical protein [Gemmataceae bacterium]